MFKKITSLIDQKLLRFILVGIVNTLVGTAIMFGLYNLAGLHTWGSLGYWISTAANYVLTSILSYFLNKYFTFQNKEKSLAQVVRFIINIAVCYLLAYGIAQPLTALALSGFGKQVQDNVAMLVGMCLFVALNYLGQRLFAFKEKKPEEENKEGKEEKEKS